MAQPQDIAYAPRDLVGYANHLPSFQWPQGGRLALNLVINFEEGSERNPLDGDLDREPLVEAKYDVPAGERELFTESTFEYGSRVGVWRLLELLDEFQVTATVFACGLALERNPAVAKAFVARGYDFVGHGYRWVPHTGMTTEQEHGDVRMCADAVRKMTGYSIHGWFTRPPNTVNTRQVLIEEGLLYDSGAVNDDLPYFQVVQGRPMLIVPYSLDVNDTKFFKNQFFTARDFESYAIDSFDTLHAQSQRSPLMMSVGLHSRIIGRPGRLIGLRRFLEHVRRHNDVWITGRDTIATFWADEFAPESTWNLPKSEPAFGQGEVRPIANG
jgi:allantoinase